MRNFALLLLAFTACCAAAQSETKCHPVSGGIVTNFVDSADTFGSASGDLAGGVGVHVVSQQPGANGAVVITVQHHWVTATGDTISLDEGVATALPTSVPGLYAVSYLDGVDVKKNGTGAFAGVTGKIYAWGAVDFTKNELVLRYSGQICTEQ